MIRALIFDFDGLILETETPVFRSWQELYRSLGAEILMEEWVKIIGTEEGSFDLVAALEQQIGRKIEREAHLPRRREREMALIAEQTVLPGVEDYLRDARKMGLKLGVASSSPREWVTTHLDRLGLLEYFVCFRTSDDVERAKPDPALFLKSLECLQVEPEQAVVFEDSLNGVRAARAASIFTVAIPNPLTRDLDYSEADLRLDSLADHTLEELLRRIREMRNSRGG